MTATPLLSSWLAAARDNARQHFATVPPPSPANEIWRYSRISLLPLDRFVSHPEAATVEITTSAPAVVRALSDLAEGEGDVLLDALRPSDADSFHDLAIAELGHGCVIDVPAGAVVAEPIRVRTRLSADGAKTATRVIVRMGADSEATVIDETSSDDVESLLMTSIELHVGDGARLRYVSVQELGPRVWHLANVTASTGKDATLRTLHVGLGGSYARLRTDATAVGRNAHNELLAVYFGSGEQMHDFRTVQAHEAPNSSSDLIFKGAVADTSRSVYSGLIRIAENARKTTAQQTNRTLLVSGGASAESVPNLEILNNDVKCAHGSTVGPIEDDHRYYVESRGVPPDVAERLIVLGHVADVIDRVPDRALAERLIATVTRRFEERRS